MTLCLHKGAEEVPYDQLCTLDTPEATATHVPIPHHRLVEMLKHSLTFYGHEVTEEHHSITKDGARYFGLLSLKSIYGDYTDTCGLRNSHDKSFPVGVAYGSRVFVCDNLSFFGEHVIRRKHTARALRDVHAVMAEVIATLDINRNVQHTRFERYKATMLPITEADHLIMELYRREVLNIQRIPDVVKQFERPAHDWGDKTAWRLFNAVTFTLAGRIAENPQVTRTLHNVLDGVCETVQ